MTLSGRAISLFAVPADDLDLLRAADERVGDDPRLADWVGGTADAIRAAVGHRSPPPPLPPRPDGETDTVAYLPVLAFARALPTTLGWAEGRGLPPAVVAATMRDVGRMLVRSRQWFGPPGLGDELGGWLTRHLVGSILEVGRLQHERTTSGIRTGEWLVAERADWMPGETVVNLHIPDSGPLAPAAVGESLRAANTLLRKRFPEDRLRVRICVSWLLDPQLTHYLPESSNIVAFQRLFRVGPAKDDDGDAAVRKFVFENSPAPVEDLPQRTALERAVVSHWRAGRHWRVHVGRLP